MRTTTIFLTAALILASFIGISCRKEMSETAEGTSVTVIGTINDDGATKVTLSENTTSNVIKTAWEVGDNIIGWDELGNPLELKIASSDRITADGTAVFTLVQGTLPTASGKKIYMIYAPGKTYSSLLGVSGLTYDLSAQSDKVPALMTATGILTGGKIDLNFSKALALVAVKNPKLPVSSVTGVLGLKLSGSNVKSSVTINKSLVLNSSGSGPITKSCIFTTAADGTTSGVMEYFAVAPNTTTDQVTVSTVSPPNYDIIKTGANFVAGNCYVLDTKNVDMHKFTITIPSVPNGSFTTSPSGSAAWGETVTVTANPNTGYELASLTYNDGAVHDIMSSKSFPMPQKDVTVSGSFQLKVFNITTTGTWSGTSYAVTGGTYTIKRGTDNVTTAKMGETITVTPAPNTGYSGGTVSVKTTVGNNDVTVTGNQFIMPAADVTITVTFNQVPYNISCTVTPVSSGSVKFTRSGSTAGITQAYYNEVITVNATPNTGYKLVSIQWKQDGGINDDITSTKQFTMPANNVTVTVTFKESDTGTIGGHDYVKIGNTKWATCNVGAVNPQDYGSLYSWGETGSKSSFTEGNYAARGITTNISPDSGYDAARVNWHSPWRMPTSDEFQALYYACWTGSIGSGFTFTTEKGIYWCNNYQGAAAGLLFCDGSGRQLFFPAAGYGYGADRNGAGASGYYWSSSRGMGSTADAYDLFFVSGTVEPQSNDCRYYGFSVRPVSD